MILNKQLTGSFVILKEITPDDFDVVIKWRNNPELNRYLNQPELLTLDSQQRWYESYLMDKTQILYIINDIKTGEAIGTVGGSNIDYEQKTMDFGRLVFASQPHKFGPHYIETIKLFLDYFVDEMGLNPIYSYVFPENKSALSFDQKIGFVINNPPDYPENCTLKGLPLIEMVLTQESYVEALKKINQIFEHYRRKFNR